MTIKLICCDVFARIVCGFVSKSQHIIDVEFLPMLAHEKPEELREQLQRKIDECLKVKKYDQIVLGYGLCGNSIHGLKADIPMVIPRIHDCCTMMMGGREKFLKEFGGALSMRWCSNGYYERCHMIDGRYDSINNQSYKTSQEYMDYVEEYGEETAEYLWETMHPEIETDEAAYIKMEGFEFSNSLEGFKADIEKAGKTLKVLEGDTDYLYKLVNGPWSDSLFQTVMPGQKVAPVYDMVRVIEAV